MCTWAAHSVVFLLSVSDSPGVGFWASSELLEFYDTPNMHQAFSFLDRFLAKSSPFFSILPNFYFAPRSAAQSSLMSLGSHMHTLDTLRSARVPPARHAQPPASSSRALGSVCRCAGLCKSCVCSSLTLQLHWAASRASASSGFRCF